eukprot:TRINITY_DN61521_c0_g1_i2.p3 TRINITY_DN61521_c0_g1~~TRINITY_DN61521_c0_g1_i2.p3  ORF type:complete len:101 (-),score=21.88 TRINITY_DN61521_c0_g1_i2:212-514(-)
MPAVLRCNSPVGWQAKAFAEASPRSSRGSEASKQKSAATGSNAADRSSRTRRGDEAAEEPEENPQAGPKNGSKPAKGGSVAFGEAEMIDESTRRSARSRS